jgi:hypothetical protein
MLMSSSDGGALGPGHFVAVRSVELTEQRKMCLLRSRWVVRDC